MPSRIISTVVVKEDADLSIARRRVMKVTELLGVSENDQTRSASAVSEVVRTMMQQASQVRVLIGLDRRELTIHVEGDKVRPAVPDVSRLVDGVETDDLAVRISVDVPDDVEIDVVEVIDALVRTGNLTALEALRERNQELKVALDEKARAEATAALALEIAHLGIWELDAAGVLRSDDRCARLHGLNEALELTLDMLLRFGGQALEDAIADESSVSLALEYAVDGRWLSTRGRRARDGAILCAVLDVTESRRYAEHAQARAEFLEQMVGVVSHDLKSPLQLVGMGTSLLEDTELDDRQKKVVHRIKRGCDRAGRLVVDLLDFTVDRLGDGIPVNKRKATLESVVKEIAAGTALSNPDVSIDVTSSDESAGRFDPDRIAQVVQNLLDNAVEHAPPGSTVEARVEGNDGELAISVTNQGPPIPPELLPSVFSPLTQSEEDGRSKKRIGLGLYIVRAIAKAHGGRAEVASSDENGTVFRITIPR